MDLSAFKKRPSGKFAKFGTPGATTAGTVTEISDQKQATKWNPDPKAPRELDFWPSGDPVMEVWITVQTNERDPQDPEDTGSRVLVVTVNQKAGGPLAAIMDACEAAGAETPLPGGFLALTFTQFDPDSKNPQNPRKLYAGKYQAPAPGGGAFQPPAPAAAAPAAAPQYNEWNPAPQAAYAPLAAAPATAPPSWATAPAAAAPAAQQPPVAYAPPVQVNTATGEITEPAAATPAPAAAPPVAALAPAAAPKAWDASAVQGCIAAGMDDATIHQATGAPLVAIAAIRQISG